MSYKSNYTGEQIDKVIGDNLEVNIKDLKRELDDAKDIITYDISELYGSIESSESRELNVDSINKVFGSPDSLMYNLENKHVRFTTSDEGIVTNTDVTSSMTIGESEGYLSLTHEVGFLGEAVVTCSYVFIFDKTKEPYTFTYGQLTQYSDSDQITTGFIADEAVTTEKIADGAITQDKLADGVGKDIVEYELPYEIESQSSPFTFEITEEEFNRIFGSLDGYLYNVEHKHIRFKTTLVVNEEVDGVITKVNMFHTFDVLTSIGGKGTQDNDTTNVVVTEGNCKVGEGERLHFTLSVTHINFSSTGEYVFECVLTVVSEDVDSKISSMQNELYRHSSYLEDLNARVYDNNTQLINLGVSVTSIYNNYVSQSQMQEAIANAITTTLNTEV